ncbi:tyrosine-type recombinase/integrase [Antribacter sp. KLBMP9083]|uniref:Tyrosine-type recombinase/integrase n=1 Tax=Antribacter soli TaxID=2910976 RepID=A0AA41U7V2_9MICO|nr:tyrosine-type recombinase/integrase [Antribacter soli]MCF4121996.1 tyrosine-type recombinase/integrase [Antribacter soli]
MTTSLIPAPARADQALPPGLTAEDIDRIVAAVAAEHASSTLAVYASAWRIFARWCAGRGMQALPADSATVCAYLTDRAHQGKSYATLDLACAAIRYEHLRTALPNPIADATVGRVRRGLRRIIGVAPRRQSRPLLGEDICCIVEVIDAGTTTGVRDRALILLGFASALRRPELAALTLADLAFEPGGILVTVRRSKTDPDGRGQVIAAAAGAGRATDPVEAVRAWLQVRGTRPGALFTRVAADGTAGPEALSGRTICRVVHDRARDAGVPADRVSTHSLRAGHATTAAMAGVPLDRIAAQTRHRDLATLVHHHIRPIEEMTNTSSRALGL